MRLDDLRNALDEAAGDPVEAAPAYERVVRRAQASRHRRMAALAAVLAVVVAVPAGIFWSAGDRDGTNGERVETEPGTAGPTSGSPEPDVTDPQRPEEVQKALDRWTTFPSDRTPRPIVVGDLVNAPASGFLDDTTKEAYASGRFTLATDLPHGPATAGDYPLISGQELLDRLRTDGSPGPSSPTTLTITSIKLASASFQTDRGPQELPTWLFTFEGVSDPAEVLAIGAPRLFVPPPGIEPPSMSGAIGPTSVEGNALVVRFVGAAAGTGPCNAEYTVDVYPAEFAVAVVVRELPRPPITGTSQNAVCTAVGYERSVTVTLDSPLGGRVVIEGETGAAIAVH